MNYQFDLEEWMKRIPLETKQDHYSGEDVTGPVEICNNEWLRLNMRDAYDWGEEWPADLFVMADGEPENRASTKIGGLPYRAASEPWPLDDVGQPLDFIAQFDFSDSEDIVGKTPADILLIFAKNDDGWFEQYYFEWISIQADQESLVSEVPQSKFPFKPCYGYRCRVNNYPFAEEKESEGGYPQCLGKDVWSSYFLTQYQATQIGMAPFEPQAGIPEDWTPLCTVASVQPDMHSKFPWVNREHPLYNKGEWNFQHQYLMIGDLGCIFICVDDNGQLKVHEECY